MEGGNSGDVEGAEVLREENRMDGDCVVRLYWLEDFGKIRPQNWIRDLRYQCGRIVPPIEGCGWRLFGYRLFAVLLSVACCACCLLSASSRLWLCLT